MGTFTALLGVIASPHMCVSCSTLGVRGHTVLMGVPARTLGVDAFASSAMDASSCMLMLLGAGAGTAVSARALGSWLGSLGSCTATPMQHDTWR